MRVTKRPAAISEIPDSYPKIQALSVTMPILPFMIFQSARSMGMLV